MTESISVIGLGLMGQPIARRLAAGGFEVRGWNRTPLSPEAAAGIVTCADLSEAAAADVLLIMLANSIATGQILDELGPQLRRGALVLDMGSSEPAHSRSRAQLLGERDIEWVDAPVSGGPRGAASGSLAIMAGGSRSAVTRARPVLDALGTNVAHVGGPGAGHAMKVVNQVIVALGIEAVAEALALAASLGFDARTVQAALRGGSADTPQLRSASARVAQRDYTPGAKVQTMLKDLRMAETLADSLELGLPQVRGACALYTRVAQSGGAEADCTILYELFAADGRL